MEDPNSRLLCALWGRWGFLRGVYKPYLLQLQLLKRGAAGGFSSSSNLQMLGGENYSQFLRLGHITEDNQNSGSGQVAGGCYGMSTCQAQF